jgi:hypothetical protein
MSDTQLTDTLARAGELDPQFKVDLPSTQQAKKTLCEKVLLTLDPPGSYKDFAQGISKNYDYTEIHTEADF